MADEIRFYRATGQFGFLSNLYPYPVMLNDRGGLFPSSEHAYQWHKPNKPEIAEWIRQAPHPRLAAIVGHGLFYYDVIPGWNDKKVAIMRSVLEAKFRDTWLREKLLATGDAILIEASKTDAFWGIGAKGTGKNTLGVLLMELRLPPSQGK